MKTKVFWDLCEGNGVCATAAPADLRDRRRRQPHRARREPARGAARLAAGRSADLPEAGPGDRRIMPTDPATTRRRRRRLPRRAVRRPRPPGGGLHRSTHHRRRRGPPALRPAAAVEVSISARPTRTPTSAHTTWMTSTGSSAPPPSGSTGVPSRCGSPTVRPSTSTASSSPPGRTPRRCPATTRRGVHSIRTLDDAVAFRVALGTGAPRVALVGAGFIGAEVASTCVEPGHPRDARSSAEDQPVQPLARRGGRRRTGQVSTSATASTCAERTAVRRVLGDETGHRARARRRLGRRGRTCSCSPSACCPPPAGLKGPVCPWTTASSATTPFRSCPAIVAAGDVARWPNRRLGEFRRSSTGSTRSPAASTPRAPFSVGPSPTSSCRGSGPTSSGSSCSSSARPSTTTRCSSTAPSTATAGSSLCIARATGCGVPAGSAATSSCCLRDSVGRPGSWAAAVERALIRSAA